MAKVKKKKRKTNGQYYQAWLKEFKSIATLENCWQLIIKLNYKSTITLLLTQEKRTYILILKKLYWNTPAAFIYYCPKILKTTQKTFNW